MNTPQMIQHRDINIKLVKQVNDPVYSRMKLFHVLGAK